NLVLRADNTALGLGTVIFDALPSQLPPIRVVVDDGPPVIGPCLCQGPRAATAAPTQATTLSPGMVDFSQSSGAVSIYYNPQTYTNPTIYSANVTGQLTAYMLVNNVTNLQDISTNPNGTYALGTNINAGAFAPLPSSTPFNGLLDGNGGLGVNYTISNL